VPEAPPLESGGLSGERIESALVRGQDEAQQAGARREQNERAVIIWVDKKEKARYPYIRIEKKV
jgi:hypothetical protein